MIGAVQGSGGTSHVMQITSPRDHPPSSRELKERASKREPYLWKDADGPREQGGDLAMTQETTQTEGKEAEGSEHQDIFEDEESNPDALDRDSTCPSKEDTAYLQGTHGCKSCRYALVRTPKTFNKAQGAIGEELMQKLPAFHLILLSWRLDSTF
ncbi:hypothetical protein STEG23_005262 [Scotinomys teguina]